MLRRNLVAAVYLLFQSLGEDDKHRLPYVDLMFCVPINM
jgi:hypothetical protein